MKDKDKEIIDRVTKNIEANLLLNELSKQYDIYDLLTFDQYNVQEKITKNAYMQELFKWNWIAEKSKLSKIQSKLEILTGERYNYYKFKDSRELSKVEIEKYYLPIDPEIKKLKQLLDLQEVRTWFFECLYTGFKSQAFNITQYLKDLNI